MSTPARQVPTQHRQAWKLREPSATLLAGVASLALIAVASAGCAADEPKSSVKKSTIVQSKMVDRPAIKPTTTKPNATKPETSKPTTSKPEVSDLNVVR